MRKAVFSIVATIVLSLGAAASAQIGTPGPPTIAPSTQEPAASPADSPGLPGQQSPPVTTDDVGDTGVDVDDDDDGLSDTAILLLVLGGVILLLLIFAIVYSQRRRPGDPRPLD